MNPFYKPVIKNNKISDLCAFAKENQVQYKEINFGNVPNFQAQYINQITQLRINSATKVLSSFALNHIIKKHGKETRQEERGQKTITDADFEYIPTIFSEYESVENGGKNSKGKDCLLYKKQINGYTYHLVASIAISKNKETNKEEINLYVNTMYAKK